MWSKLSKQLSIVAITLILFVILMIGMSSLSQTGGGAWGFDDSIPPEEAAQKEPERGAHSMRIAYAKRYNSYVSPLLSGIGKVCKLRSSDEILRIY